MLWIYLANPPFVTEDDPVGAFLPQQIQRADLFDYGLNLELTGIIDNHGCRTTK